MRIPFFKVVYGSDFSKGLNKVPGFQGGLWENLVFLGGLWENLIFKVVYGRIYFQCGLWKN